MHPSKYKELILVFKDTKDFKISKLLNSYFK